MSYEDFKIKTFKTIHTRTPMYSLVSNEASVLEHIAPIYFPIYSVVIILHSSVNECAPMIGLTKFALSFLESITQYFG
jgi:hypothetical protein